MSQQINLFNPVFRPQGFSFTSARAMAYAVGIAIGVVALTAVYADYELRQVVAQAQASDGAHKEATARLAKLTTEVAQQKPDAQLAADIAALEAQLKGRQEVVETLRSGAVGNTAGFSEYMRAFSRQTLTGLWLTGFEIDGNELLLRGRAVNPELVASFLKQLNREPVLQGREFSAMRISQPSATDAAAPAKADKGQKDAGQKDAGQKDARMAAALPRYIEFSISTAALADDPQKAGASPLPVAAVRPPAPPAAGAVELARVVAPVKNDPNQGAAK